MISFEKLKNNLSQEEKDILVLIFSQGFLKKEILLKDWPKKPGQQLSNILVGRFLSMRRFICLIFAIITASTVDLIEP